VLVELERRGHLEEPAPIPMLRTGSVAAGGGEVEIWNGDPALNRLVR
jgi:hypothetical protein